MVPRTGGLHHVALVSGDAERTLGFYRDVLGLRLVRRGVDPGDPGVERLYLGDEGGAPGTILGFTVEPGSPRGMWGIGGVHHLALGVADEEALLRWKRWLMDRGVRVSGPYDRHWFSSLYFTDPDGQVLELATAGPGYGLDEPMDALGERVIVPDASHLRGGRDEEAIRRRTWPEPVGEIGPGMALQGIHHVSGITDDVERANDFYEAALGLRLVKRTVNQDDPSTPHWFWASYDGTRVEPHSSYTLFGWPRGRRSARSGAGQARSLAFRAAGEDALPEWRDHLLSLGVEVSPVMDGAHFRSISFRAPDGQLLEVAADGPGFAGSQ